MLCDTCRWTERPGFIRQPQTAKPSESGSPEAVGFIPCPDCGGQTVAHCCEGLCEQPEPDSPGADA